MRLLASKRSAGQEIQFKGQPLIVEELVPESFEGIDLALFSAGGGIVDLLDAFVEKISKVAVTTIEE